MTGLNLETFLRLLRADLGVWVSLGLVAALLAVMTWTSWGSRRALRKCLFLSIAVHLGLIVYGSNSPGFRQALRLDTPVSKAKVGRADRPVRITPVVVNEKSPANPESPNKPKVADWDLDRGALVMAEATRVVGPSPVIPAPALARAELAPIEPTSVAPEVTGPPPTAVPSVALPTARAAEPLPTVAEVDPAEVAPLVATRPGPIDVPLSPSVRIRPGPVGPAGSPPSRTAPIRSAPEPSRLPEPQPVEVAEPRNPKLVEKIPVVPMPARVEAPTPSTEELEPGPPTAVASAVAPPPPATVETSPEPDPRRVTRPSVAPNIGASGSAPTRLADNSAPQAMPRVAPTGPPSASAPPRPTIRRSLSDVPLVYRSRLDPNRTTLAQRSGATLASEQAVERALDWLARHQDVADGRWDGGTQRGRDGNVIENDDSFTIHCPAGEVCFGECIYWEADTALTGLSLLAYLGAGYTHLDGKYASVVTKGLEFLLRSQKPDGDLRGSSLAVGMYCHSMATLALCEAYALTGDSRLRMPVERAVDFLVRSRSRDGLAWRYSPRAADSDTSILGWAVMALKSAKAVGIAIPSDTQAGMFAWLKKISRGPGGGLAFYNFELNKTKVTPTMTAEAWACRQFLEIGGPGPASDEAAAYLLANPTDKAKYNIYYLYYGTLAMYQHGGDSWTTWNARVRDDVVKRQRVQGHMAGSWDPDDSPYGPPGGRIYGTALATLTLEVYYRFLRLYEPSPGEPVAPRVGPESGPRRVGLEPGSPGR